MAAVAAGYVPVIAADQLLEITRKIEGGPVGALVPKRPKHSSTVRVKEDRYYFQSGYFYKKEGRAGYRVVPPPVGAVVPYLPKGYTAKIIYGDRYYEFAGALYNPIVINGRRYYQTVRIRGR